MAQQAPFMVVLLTLCPLTHAGFWADYAAPQNAEICVLLTGLNDPVQTCTVAHRIAPRGKMSCAPYSWGPYLAGVPGWGGEYMTQVCSAGNFTTVVINVTQPRDLTVAGPLA